MMEEQLKINYQISVEAEDISQSRIRNSISFLKNLLENCNNPYLHHSEFTDESDMDDFMLQFYAEGKIEEEQCSSPEHAKSFVMDMSELLDAYAQPNSFLRVEGKFEIVSPEENGSFTFCSDNGQNYCEVKKIE